MHEREVLHVLDGGGETQCAVITHTEQLTGSDAQSRPDALATTQDLVGHAPLKRLYPWHSGEIAFQKWGNPAIDVIEELAYVAVDWPKADQKRVAMSVLACNGMSTGLRRKDVCYRQAANRVRRVRISSRLARAVQYEPPAATSPARPGTAPSLAAADRYRCFSPPARA
jgi:hypothetical protein